MVGLVVLLVERAQPLLELVELGGDLLGLGVLVPDLVGRGRARQEHGEGEAGEHDEADDEPAAAGDGGRDRASGASFGSHYYESIAVIGLGATQPPRMRRSV